MRKKKLTQEQRITTLEKAVSNIYMMVQAVIQKLPDERKEEKKD